MISYPIKWVFPYYITFFVLSVNLLLILQSSGEAQEVFSVRQGPVRVLRLLPTPETGTSVKSWISSASIEMKILEQGPADHLLIK